MTNHIWLDVILLVWFVVSAMVTPLVGRYLGNLFDPADEKLAAKDEPVSLEHHTADL